MKDSSKLLGFDQNRDLYFDEFRGVDFPVHRELLFDSDRKLFFDSQRELPFGKKGVEFRHFICGGCGEVVNGEAARCPKCRAVFKGDEEQIKTSIHVRFSGDVRHSDMAEHFGEEYTERPHTHVNVQTRYRCKSCGNDLRYIGGAGKWYCDRCKIYIRSAPTGVPRKVRVYTPQAGGAGGVKFVEDREVRRGRPSEFVIVEDINK